MGPVIYIVGANGVVMCSKFYNCRILMKPKSEKKGERSAWLVFKLIVFVQNNFFSTYFFAFLVFALIRVWAIVEKCVS